MSEQGFAEQGFAVLPIFDPTAVKAAEADIAEQIDRVAGALYMPFDRSRPDVTLGERLDRIAERDQSYANLLRVALCTDAHRGPRLSAMSEDPALLEAGSRLAGRRIGGTVMRVRASIAAFPEHRHAWHSDVALDDGSDCGRVCITAWIPLSHAGPDSGGLEIVLGRRAAPIPHRREDGFHIPEDVLRDQPRFTPTCPLGSALFLDRFTPHRTLPVTTKARFALVVWMKGL